jgi:hypothetical protein
MPENRVLEREPEMPSPRRQLLVTSTQAHALMIVLALACLAAILAAIKANAVAVETRSALAAERAQADHIAQSVRELQKGVSSAMGASSALAAAAGRISPTPTPIPSASAPPAIQRRPCRGWVEAGGLPGSTCARLAAKLGWRVSASNRRFAGDFDGQNVDCRCVD